MKLLRIRKRNFGLALNLVLISSFAFSQQLHLSAQKAQLGEVHYSARVGGTVPSQGDTFLVQVLSKGDILRRIQVGVYQSGGSRVVQAIRFIVEDSVGKLQKILIGHADSYWKDEIDVPKGAELIGISGASGWWIDRIRFHFSDGSSSSDYGGGRGDTDFHLLLAQRDNKWKGRWLGVWGTHTDYLESLGLIFWPVE
ncbi:MAG: hypothetical protein WBA23_08895 [Tunicatimonas sp.]|uniref:hypothetical protein n=1 Tax=Tunicatimonas sp. TaxID=1940096 RepID=UPI003C72A1D2